MAKRCRVSWGRARTSGNSKVLWAGNKPSQELSFRGNQVENFSPSDGHLHTYFCPSWMHRQWYNGLFGASNLLQGKLNVNLPAHICLSPSTGWYWSPIWNLDSSSLDWILPGLCHIHPCHGQDEQVLLSMHEKDKDRMMPQSDSVCDLLLTDVRLPGDAGHHAPAHL